MLTIHLEKLRFFAYHGLYELEKKVGNEFEVNISVSFKTENKILTNFSETINYITVYEIVRDEMQKPRELLETLITELAGKIKDRFPQVLKLQIKLFKLNAPLENFEGKMGVELVKQWGENMK
jgi:7,8-dihydroneopterin aldolase/epimerase/oxygenase